MTIFDHWSHYAIPSGIALTYFGVPHEVTVPTMALTGMLNTIPDMAGIAVAFTNPLHHHVTEEKLLGLSFPMRWDVYVDFHNGTVASRWGWIWWAHLVVDRWMHFPNGAWWPRDWKKVVPIWLVEAAGIMLLIHLWR